MSAFEEKSTSAPTKRILVIDDEADIREIARMSLQMTNCWDVLIAASGEEGVAIAATERPDVILLDAIMPGMDGLATLQRLKEDPKTQDLPVLLLTATMSPTTQQQYVQLGARAVLMKPFDPGTLARQIEQALGWSIEGTV